MDFDEMELKILKVCFGITVEQMIKEHADVQSMLQVKALVERFSEYEKDRRTAIN